MTVPRDLFAGSRAWLRPLGPVLAGAALVALSRPSYPRAADDRAALALALAARGLECSPEDVAWEPPAEGSLVGRVGGVDARALVRARAPGETYDLYRVAVRRSPEGRVLDVGAVHDLTATRGVDESPPILLGAGAPLVAYTSSADGLVSAVHVLDLRGHRANAVAELTQLQRAQAALTNLQQTGSLEGVGHDTFALDPAGRDVTLGWRADGTLEVRADRRVVVIEPLAPRVTEGASFIRVVADERARPGNLVTWAVDRVRAIPWFGDDRMQWIKAVAFTAMDSVAARFAHGTTSQEVQDELGLAPASLGPTTYADPEIGWPPPPMTVPVSPALPGEGQWIPLDHDAFITPTAAGAAPAFATSFVRPDVHRQDVRVYVTLWDPRQIALHAEAGTVEPVAANGEHGPGLVPRTPEVLKHLVAAFNGGFQAEHGEYGMEANGIEYLPPKPYAASVVELRDGSEGFGAWPGPLPGGSTPTPPDVIGFRQNLTALVEGGRFNPWGRNWWGGTPPGWPDQIHSARSAICLTREGFVGYFYSASISAEDLALGMLDARCDFGIHLDMNPGHAGFEFYDVGQDAGPAGKLAPLGRPFVADWEAEGRVPGMPGWSFRARRMIRGMGHMLFPRYIQREARDFFYLTSRSVLPGAPVGGALPGDGAWTTTGLPQHGFPYAIALAGTHPASRSSLALRLVRVDPRAVKAADPADTSPTVLALAAPVQGALQLWWSPGVFSVGGAKPSPEAVAMSAGYPASAAVAVASRAEVGVQDEDGMLVWVELAPGALPDAQSAGTMDGLLESLGCSERMAIPGDARAMPGGNLDAAGQPLPKPPAATARLVRARAPDAHAVFTDTPIVPAAVWQPLQAKRVRYFYKPPPAASSAGAAPAPVESAIRVDSNR